MTANADVLEKQRQRSVFWVQSGTEHLGDRTSEPSGMKTLNSLFDFFLELFKTMCEKSYDGENADDYMQNCYSEKPFLEQAPTFYRFGVPGLGNIKEKWNMYPAWRKVNDAINIPQLREKTASESKNFVKCEESGYPIFIPSS